MPKTFLQLLVISLLAWATLLHSTQAQSSPFITRWDLSKPGGAATTLTFGVATAGTVSYTWQQVGGTTVRLAEVRSPSRAYLPMPSST